MKEIMDQFYGGMRACVRSDDDAQSGSRWHKGYGKGAYFPRCCTTFHSLRYLYSSLQY